MEMQYSYVSTQLEEGKKQFSQVQAAVNETKETLKAIEQLSTAGKESNMVSLGSGAFVKTGSLDSQTVLIGIGAGVIAAKTPQEATAMLKERVEKLAEVLSNIDKSLMKLQNSRDALAAAFEQLQRG